MCAVITFSRNAVPLPVFAVPLPVFAVLPPQIVIPPPKVVVSPPRNVFMVHIVFFGQLILRKIINTVATRCQILRLDYTKCDFDWGSAPDLAGQLTALIQTPSWI